MIYSKLSLLDIICDSHGNFDDALIENSFLFKNIKSKESIISNYFNKNSNNVSSQAENIVLNIEKDLNNRFSHYDIFTYNGMKDFVRYLSSCISKYDYIFLNPITIDSILNSIFDENELSSGTNPYEKMCWTRLIANEKQIELLYSNYLNIEKNLFVCKKIDEYVIENNCDNRLILLDKKCTIWDEKLGGTIFLKPFERDTQCRVPYLRTIYRYFHYYYELKLTSQYYMNIDETVFGEKFHSFIVGKHSSVDFFDPHAILESIAWEYSINTVYKCFLDNCNISWLNEPNWYWENGTFISDCVIDIVSNLSHNRNKNQRQYRTMSMLIKKDLFKILTDVKDDIILEKILINSMSEGSMEYGYKCYLFDK